MVTKYMRHVSQLILKPTSWENVRVILHLNSLLHNANPNSFWLSLRHCFISTSQYFYFLYLRWYNHPTNKPKEALTCHDKQYRIYLSCSYDSVASLTICLSLMHFYTAITPNKDDLIQDGFSLYKIYYRSKKNNSAMQVVYVWDIFVVFST